MTNKTRLKIQSIPLVLLVSSTLTWADDSAIAAAKQAFNQQNFKKVYELLAPMENEFSGDPELDFVFGYSGVEVGDVTRGVFALERVLAQNPNNQQARAEIAKAHFKLGENDSAKEELNNLLSQNPDAEVKNAINRYMNAIDKALGLTTTFNAYLDFGIGYDSNINSATSSNSILAPGILPGVPFALSNNSQEKSDNFTTLTGGVSFRAPINQALSAFGGLNLSNRMNQQDTIFDTTMLDANVGIKYQYLKNSVSAAWQSSTFELDGARFRNSNGATLQWQHDLDDKNQLSLYGQMAELEYKGAKIRDADRYVLGGGWIHLFEGDKSPILFISPYVGKEETHRNAGDFLSFDMFGLRLGGQLSFTPKWVGYANIGYEKRDYDSQDPIFLKTRDDDQYEFTLGARYIPIKDWLIKPQISYIDNQSNITLNDYDRTVISINFRHDFNW